MNYSFIFLVLDVEVEIAREKIHKRKCLGDAKKTNTEFEESCSVISFLFYITNMTICKIGKNHRNITLQYDKNEKIDQFVCRNSESYDIDVLNFTINKIQLMKTVGKHREIRFKASRPQYNEK